MRTIEVKSCSRCPFKKVDEYHEWFCNIGKTLFLPERGIHPECPLKKESVTVKVKVKEHENQ